VFDITATEPREIDDLLSLMSREYAHAEALTLRVDPYTPASVEARLAFDGYERIEALVMVIDGPLRGTARRFEILPIQDEVSWQAYSDLKRLDRHESIAPTDAQTGHSGLAERLVAGTRLKCPPAQYVMAYVDGSPAGYCSTWEGLKGVGQVEDLLVHPAYRHRGIATALLHHSVAAARARGAGPVVIVVYPANTAKNMYSALGWQPVVTCRQYTKKRERT
jgi:GNAT superfamily N-acetyltransferase